jgi:hypothetical protein
VFPALRGIIASLSAISKVALISQASKLDLVAIELG